MKHWNRAVDIGVGPRNDVGCDDFTDAPTGSGTGVYGLLNAATSPPA